MTNSERILDIESTGNFDKQEVKKNYDKRNTFTSHAFYIIFHYTNAELYYSNHERENLEEHADEIFKTKKGIFYCFN
jgi:hypothetical protein